MEGNKNAPQILGFDFYTKKSFQHIRSRKIFFVKRQAQRCKLGIH